MNTCFFRAKADMKLVAAAACLAMAGLLPAAQAANLLTNGDFEAGDLSGWLATGPMDFVGADPFAAHGGGFGAYFGPETPATLSQTVSTTPGGSYEISFWLSLQDSAQPNNFSWTWNGVTESGSFDNTAAFGYTQFTAVVSATGGSSTVSFSFTNPQSFWLMDDVSVSAVPEPSGLLLAGGGVVLLALLKGRRRRGG